MTDTIPAAVREWWLAESGRRDLELARRLDAWREGHAAARAAQADAYERGFHDGAMARKRAQHQLVTLARLQAARYGPASRQATNPQPGDFPALLIASGGTE